MLVLLVCAAFIAKHLLLQQDHKIVIDKMNNSNKKKKVKVVGLTLAQAFLHRVVSAWIFSSTLASSQKI